MIPIMKPTLPKYETLEARFRDIFETGWITNGKHVEEFERVCADYLGTKFAVAVSSGTMALIASIKCLNLTGKVILPSFTWCASAHALLWNDLEPVFVDIEPDSFNIDPKAVESAITRDTAAIIAVHMFGNPCDVEALQGIAQRHGLKLIYDCAHAFGSKYKGHQLGHYGNCGAYSLSPSKIITTGEGGIVSTNDKELAERVKLFRNQGVIDYNANFIGMNGRMTEMQAILGTEMVPMTDSLVERKQRLLSMYLPKLRSIPGVGLQKIKENSISTYKDFNILIDPSAFGANRDYLESYLNDREISTKKYYYPPVHRQKAFLSFFDKYNHLLPNTNYVSDNTLTIPLYPDMEEESVAKIVDAISKACRAM